MLTDLVYSVLIEVIEAVDRIVCPHRNVFTHSLFCFNCSVVLYCDIIDKVPPMLLFFADCGCLICMVKNQVVLCDKWCRGEDGRKWGRSGERKKKKMMREGLNRKRG